MTALMGNGGRMGGLRGTRKGRGGLPRSEARACTKAGRTGEEKGAFTG